MQKMFYELPPSMVPTPADVQKLFKTYLTLDPLGLPYLKSIINDIYKKNAAAELTQEERTELFCWLASLVFDCANREIH